MSYHVNPETGNAGLCRAKKGSCPFGSVADHHESAAAARAAFEASMTAKPDSLNKLAHKDWPEESFTRVIESKRTPGAKIEFSVGWDYRQKHKFRPIEAWLEVPGKGNVAFVKLLVQDEDYFPEAGSHLAMCDIETRVDSRKQGYARELRETIEEETGLLIYSSGSYTPEGWEAFGKHGRFYPTVSSFDKPGPKHNSMGFVASWKHKVPVDPDRRIEHSDAQREAMWELDAVFRKFQNHEILWAED